MIEILKQMYQLLLTEPHAPTLCERLERIAREAIAELESQEPVAWQDTRKTWVDVPLKNVLKEKCMWVRLKEEDYVLVNQLCINPIQAAEFVDRLLKEKNT